jgi:hypothetical protein
MLSLVSLLPSLFPLLIPREELYRGLVYVYLGEVLARSRFRGPSQKKKKKKRRGRQRGKPTDYLCNKSQSAFLSTKS